MTSFPAKIFSFCFEQAVSRAFFGLEIGLARAWSAWNRAVFPSHLTPENGEKLDRYGPRHSEDQATLGISELFAGLQRAGRLNFDLLDVWLIERYTACRSFRIYDPKLFPAFDLRPRNCFT